MNKELKLIPPFGDEQFWGDTLHLHQTIEGENFGGAGPGLMPQKLFGNSFFASI